MAPSWASPGLFKLGDSNEINAMLLFCFRVLDNVHGKRYMGSVLKVIPFSDEHVKHQRALNMSQTQESILQRLSHMSANNNGELLYPFRSVS